MKAAVLVLLHSSIGAEFVDNLRRKDLFFMFYTPAQKFIILAAILYL